MECFYAQRRERRGGREVKTTFINAGWKGKEGEGKGETCFAKKKKKKLGQMPIIPRLLCLPILAIIRAVLLKITRDGFVNKVICHFYKKCVV